MELPELASIMAIFAALNIFYSIYKFVTFENVNALISLLNYFILIYSAAIMDDKAEIVKRKSLEQG